MVNAVAHQNANHQERRMALDLRPAQNQYQAEQRKWPKQICRIFQAKIDIHPYAS
jgi:hypothetical protein